MGCGRGRRKQCRCGGPEGLDRSLRARTEDRRSRAEEAKINIEMLRQAREDQRREVDRLADQLRAVRRWNVEVRQVERDFEELEADLGAFDPAQGSQEDAARLAARVATVEQQLKALMLRDAELDV